MKDANIMENIKIACVYVDEHAIVVKKIVLFIDVADSIHWFMSCVPYPSEVFESQPKSH